MNATSVVIHFENVSKRYMKPPRTFQESLARVVDRLRCEGRATRCAAGAELWAIRNVSFSIKRGETLGIIGQNGAGKSTILKLIAGITAPTDGRVAVCGRVGTLIELGAGFNPELSGLENIYLNGMVLGLTRREIERSFDQIVAFSGLGDFLDMPVKYYSSGMYAKLGFSIAAHMKADVLLTDEILAVGDAAFQRRCLEKFQELRASTTIVFVSHDLARVKEICSRVIWMKEGRLQCEGMPEQVIEAYLESLKRDREQHLRSGRPLGPEPGAERWGSGEIEIVEVTTCDGQGEPQNVFRTFDDLIVRIRYCVNSKFQEPNFGVNIYSSKGEFIHGTNTFIQSATISILPGTGTVEIRYPRLPLLAGEYWLRVGVTAGNNWSIPYDVRDRIRSFEVLPTQSEGGLVCLEHRWNEVVRATSTSVRN